MGKVDIDYGAGPEFETGVGYHLRLFYHLGDAFEPSPDFTDAQWATAKNIARNGTFQDFDAYVLNIMPQWWSQWGEWQRMKWRDVVARA
jgi:hypothetical protein